MCKPDFIRSLAVTVAMTAGILTAVSGCAGLRSLESGQTETLARADDGTCRDRGYTWPSEAYLECRLDLQNQRARENWQRLEMASRQNAMNPGGLSGSVPGHGGSSPFRPVRKENFHCELRPSTRGDIDYVYCGER